MQFTDEPPIDNDPFCIDDLAKVGALSHAASRATRIFGIFDKNGEVCHLCCITLLRLVVLLLTSTLPRAVLHGKIQISTSPPSLPMKV